MQDNPDYLLKRAFDVTLASLLLLVMFPLGLLCALLVWLEDRYDILHYHEVIGKGGEPFRMITFRTLVPGMHRMFEGDKIAEDDPGTTNVGRFLINSRLERLPVLVNVLRGEMSFVGPSPERTEAAAVLRRKVPRYAQRYRVRPGVVSMADIYGEPSMPASQRLRFDLFYIERMTLGWDLRLLRGELRRRLRGSAGAGPAPAAPALDGAGARATSRPQPAPRRARAQSAGEAATPQASTAVSAPLPALPADRASEPETSSTSEPKASDAGEP
jgi:lipopolysaccharide/colanic/teichoic acid biosynthesis glycosyltransferase